VIGVVAWCGFLEGAIEPLVEVVGLGVYVRFHHRGDGKGLCGFVSIWRESVLARGGGGFVVMSDRTASTVIPAKQPRCPAEVLGPGQMNKLWCAATAHAPIKKCSLRRQVRGVI